MQSVLQMNILNPTESAESDLLETISNMLLQPALLKHKFV